jgi:hypothetical protein
MVAAEYVERQVAIAVVIAVKEPPLLLAGSESSVASRLRMIRFGSRAWTPRYRSLPSFCEEW